VVEVVLVESSTRPTLRSNLAHPTPLLLAKVAQGAIHTPILMVSMEATLSSLGLTHRQS
jgi:hypothetical protein